MSKLIKDILATGLPRFAWGLPLSFCIIFISIIIQTHINAFTRDKKYITTECSEIRYQHPHMNSTRGYFIPFINQ